MLLVVGALTLAAHQASGTTYLYTSELHVMKGANMYVSNVTDPYITLDDPTNHTESYVNASMGTVPNDFTYFVVPVYETDANSTRWGDYYTDVTARRTNSTATTCPTSGAQTTIYSYHDYSDWVGSGDSIYHHRVYTDPVFKHTSCGTNVWCCTYFLVEHEITGYLLGTWTSIGTDTASHDYHRLFKYSN